MNLRNQLIRSTFLTTILIICLLFLNIPAHGQNSRISIAATNKTIEQVFHDIEKQAGVKFAFNRSKFNASKKVTITQADISLEDALKSILVGTNSSYKRNGKYIIIYPTPTRALWGMVIDKETGSPIDSAIVSIYDRPSIKTTTDEEGKFSLSKVPVGDQRIVVSAEGYYPNYRSTNVVEDKESSISIMLKAIGSQNKIDSIAQEFILEPRVPVIVISTEKPTEEIKKVIAQAENIVVPKNQSGTELIKLNNPPPKFALKTNLLFWSTLSPNIGAEFTMSEKITLETSISFNPWKSDNGIRLNHLLIQAEGRYWLTRPFEGHFAGFHGAYGSFDAGGDIPLISSSTDKYIKGNLWGFGVSYGYHFPIGGKWGVELTAGVGLYKMTGDINKVVKGDEVFDDRLNKTYFGPTKLGISFVYVIK